MAAKSFVFLFLCFLLAGAARSWAEPPEQLGSPEWWLRTSESHYNIAFIGAAFILTPEQKANTDRFSHLTATPEFERALADLRASCGETRVMRLDEKFSIAYGDLYLDIRRPDAEILGFLNKAAAACARFNTILADTRVRLGGDVLQDPRALLTADGDPASLYKTAQSWADALNTADFAATVAAFKQNCRNTQVSVQLGSEREVSPGAEQSPGQLGFDVRKPAKPQLAQLKAAATACHDFLDGLDDLNARLATPRGLYFRASPSELSSKAPAIPKIIRWIQYFKADPARLDALNAAIDRAAFAPNLKRYCVVPQLGPVTVRDLGDDDCTAVQGQSRLLIVEFGPIWGSYQPVALLERLHHNEITSPIVLVYEEDYPHVPRVIPGD